MTTTYYTKRPWLTTDIYNILDVDGNFILDIDLCQIQGLWNSTSGTTWTGRVPI